MKPSFQNLLVAPDASANPPSDCAPESDGKIIHLDPARAAATSAWNGWKAARGLVWCEWYAHSRFLLGCIAMWLVGVWVLPLYANPAWILLFGALFALIAGPIFGGTDTIEGCEEFTFSLPPARRDRYLARLAVGGGAFLLFTALDLSALGLDLPQILAKLYVDTGLIHPRPLFRSGLLFGLVAAVPLAAFSFSFVLAALAHSRTLVLTAWFWSAVAALAILQLGFWYEEVVWDNLNGYFACPLLVVSAAASLWGGLKAYQRKEIGYHTAPIVLPARWWLWAIFVLVGLLLALTLAASLARLYPRLFATG